MLIKTHDQRNLASERQRAVTAANATLRAARDQREAAKQAYNARLKDVLQY